MAQIGNIQEIIEVKNILEQLKTNKIIQEWELPYENLLTRLSAAIFFFTPCDETKLSEIEEQFKHISEFRYGKNDTKSLSQLVYRLEFNNDIN